MAQCPPHWDPRCLFPTVASCVRTKAAAHWVSGPGGSLTASCRALPRNRGRRHAIGRVALLRKPPPDQSQPSAIFRQFSKPPRVQRRYRRLLSPHASHFVGVSDGSIRRFRRHHRGTQRARITTIYNPVVTPDLPGQDDGTSRSSRGSSMDGAPVILAAGRLVEAERLSYTRQGLRPCRHALARVALIIVGEGEARPALEGLVRRLKLV